MNLTASVQALIRRFRKPAPRRFFGLYIDSVTIATGEELRSARDFDAPDANPGVSRYTGRGWDLRPRIELVRDWALERANLRVYLVDATGAVYINSGGEVVEFDAECDRLRRIVLRGVDGPGRMGNPWAMTVTDIAGARRGE